MSTWFCSYQGNCISQFTGSFCETCPSFIRTGENIKEVRDMRQAQIERDMQDMQEHLAYEAKMQAETDRVWENYCEQKKNEKEANEYQEYLRLKEKYEK